MMKGQYRLPTTLGIRFTGKGRGSESGFDYFGARYYGSSMSPDPSGVEYADPSNPQTLNLYLYVPDNPLIFTDLSGLYCYWRMHWPWPGAMQMHCMPEENVRRAL